MAQVKSFLPLYLKGAVVTGFGRGGKQLGFPTANISPDAFRDRLTTTDDEGVYYGWSLIDLPGEKVEPMVMSIGWNPQFNNQEKSVEVHILKSYESDFYGKEIRVIVLGFLRPMLKFDSLEGLIEAIRNDIASAREKLVEPKAKALKDDPFWTAGKGINLRL